MQPTLLLHLVVVLAADAWHHNNTYTHTHTPGVGLMVRVVSLGSLDPDFKSYSAVELIPGGVDFACHPSEVGKMSASMLVSCVGVVTRPGLCPIAKETA